MKEERILLLDAKSLKKYFFFPGFFEVSAHLKPRF